jgi:DNA-binding MarR family transcriptional regulator
MPDDDDGLPPALAARLGYLLGQAHLAHRRFAGPPLASLGISPKAFGALSVLADEGAQSQQRLGERTGLDRTTMVAIVDELERQGFVERARNPHDRRAYALRPTSEGRRVLARASRAAERAEDEFLARLSTSEQRQLKELLRRLVSP